MNATPLTLLWMAGALAATAALALDLPDPTRPPDAVNAPLPGSVGAHVPASSPVPASTATVNRAAAARSNRLSAVLMADAPGRDAAVIDGVVRHVGDRVGDSTVASISPDGVTLKSQGHTTRLRLYDRAPDPVELAAPSGKGPGGATLAAATPPTVSKPDGASDPAKEQP
jgi:hypothetical protein